jgi:hypothetical protein
MDDPLVLFFQKNAQKDFKQIVSATKATFSSPSIFAAYHRLVTSHNNPLTTTTTTITTAASLSIMPLAFDKKLPTLKKHFFPH